MTVPRILIVDEDPAHAARARRLLESEGYAVDVRGSAGEATERLILSRPDVVVVALGPAAGSGRTLLETLRHRVHAAGVRVLLSCRNRREALGKALRGLPVDGWVRGGDPDELRRQVGRALAAARLH